MVQGGEIYRLPLCFVASKASPGEYLVAAAVRCITSPLWFDAQYYCTGISLLLVLSIYQLSLLWRPPEYSTRNTLRSPKD